VTLFAGTSLEVTQRSAVRKNSGPNLFLRRVEHRKITDRIAQRDPVRGLRPSEIPPIPNANDHQSLAVLWHSVVPRVDDASIRHVPRVFQPGQHVPHDSHVVTKCHVWNVFHEDGTRPHPLSDIEKRFPQLSPVVVSVTCPNLHEASNLGSTCSGVRLTWWSARYESYIDSLKHFDDTVSDFLFTKVELQRHALEVVRMSLQRPVIQINGERDSVSGCFESVAQAACSGEQIDGNRAF
jgi:hypothetical protein